MLCTTLRAAPDFVEQMLTNSNFCRGIFSGAEWVGSKRQKYANPLAGGSRSQSSFGQPPQIIQEGLSKMHGDFPFSGPWWPGIQASSYYEMPTAIIRYLTSEGLVIAADGRSRDDNQQVLTD